MSGISFQKTIDGTAKHIQIDSRSAKRISENHIFIRVFVVPRYLYKIT